MPEVTFDNEAAIPEGLRDIAVAKEGKFVVDVVGSKKLAEFRDNNVNLAKERDALNGTLTGLYGVLGVQKPEEFKIDDFKKTYEELVLTGKRVKDGELKTSTQIEEALKTRTAEMKAELEGQITALSKDRDEHKTRAESLDQRIRQGLIDRLITDAVLAPDSGVRSDALPDILARARGVFRVTSDEKVLPYAGDQVLYGTDGATPMTGKEWLNTLKQSASYFFKDSVGGGAGGSGGITTNGNVILVPRKTAENIAEYRAVKERAAKEGKTVQFSD